MIINTIQNYKERIEALTKLLKSLGIDTKVINEVDQRLLLAKISCIVTLAEIVGVSRVNDVIHIISNECRLPLILTLDLVSEIAKLCRESYPPVKSIVREIKTRYKLVGSRCMRALYRAIALLDC